jgi:hypothetical protein
MKIFDNPWLVWILIAVCISIGLVCRIVEGQEQKDNTSLHLAQCLRSECGDCGVPGEREGIAWILWLWAKTRGITFDEEIMQYCAVFKDYKRPKKSQERVDRIRISTFDEPLEGKPSWWVGMARWTQGFIYMINQDPYPTANHWNTPSARDRDILKGLCEVGRGSNVFYKRCKASENIGKK